jgi:hypothetical protein
MSDIAILWCGIGLGVIVAVIALVIAGATWFNSLAKPSKYIPSLRQDPKGRERALR